MIDPGSVAGLHGRRHLLACYCQHCDRWALLDLAVMIDAGHGERRLPVRVRCQVCSEIGRLQVRQRVPTLGPGGWMEAHQR